MNMFKIQGKVQSKTPSKPAEPTKLSKLQAVQSAETLLKPHRHQLQLSRIKELAHVPDDIYQRFYLPALEQVVVFVQQLPAARIVKFNKPGGLLDFTLRRTVETLAWYRRENPILGKNPAKITLASAQMTYALFTAALLLGLGYIPTQYWVSLCQEDGMFIKRWQPLEGSMEQQGAWYRLGIEPAFDKLANRSTLLLTQMLLPKEALAWLATNRDLFNAWLALLEGDLTDGGLFAKFVMPAEWLLLEQNPLIATVNEIPSLLPTEEEGLLTDVDADTHPGASEDETPVTDLQVETGPLARQAALAGNFTIVHARDLSGDMGATEIGQLFVNWLRNGIEGHSIRTDGSRGQKLLVNTEGAPIQKAGDLHLNMKELAQAFNRDLKLSAALSAAQLADGLKAAGINFKNMADSWVALPDPTALMTKIPPDSRHMTATQPPAYPEAAKTPAPTVTVKPK